MADCADGLLHGVEQCALGPALQHFGDEVPPGRQDLKRKVERTFCHRDDAYMVRCSMTGRVGGNVREHEISLTANLNPKTPWHVEVVEITLDETRARNGLDREKIDPDDVAGATLGYDLAPTTGSGSEVNNPSASMDE